MIDGAIVLPVLVLLALGQALSLLLTVRLGRSVRHHRPPAPPLPLGDTVTALSGRDLDGRRRELVAAGQPVALLFLASGCPKCRATLAQIEALLPAAAQAGLAMWIVTTEPARHLRAFLRAPALLAAAVRIPAAQFKALNPNNASPAYLFIDEQGALQAEGLIGDADWLGLRAQLDGSERGAVA